MVPDDVSSGDARIHVVSAPVNGRIGDRDIFTLESWQTTEAAHRPASGRPFCRGVCGSCAVASPAGASLGRG
jgi:hypothetical protein